MTRMKRLLAASGGCAFHIQRRSAAQGYPAKSVRVVVPYPAGGTTDLTARLVGQKMQEAMKQNVLVDNRPGAGGVIGADIVAKAAPDGYTVLIAVPAEIVILPHLQKMPYSVARDLAPVSLAAVTPLVLVVHPSLPVKSVKELVALVKARPGQLTYASAGTGGVQHLSGELLKITMKLDLAHVPYKGAGAYACSARRSRADVFLGHAAGDAAREGGKAARAGGDDDQTLVCGAGRAHHGGSRCAGLRHQQLVCVLRAFGHAG